MKNLLSNLGVLYVLLMGPISFLFVMAIIVVGEHQLINHSIGAYIVVLSIVQFGASAIAMSLHKFKHREKINAMLFTTLLVLAITIMTITLSSPMVFGICSFALICMLALGLLINIIQR